MTDGVQSLITQVSRDNPVPVVRQPPPPRPKSFFERICGCCYSPPRDSVDDGIAMTQTSSGPHPGPAPKQTAKPKSQHVPGSLLGPMLDEHTGRKTLVLDLDETLVHSSFKPLPYTDFQIEVEVDGVIHPVYVSKRPFVDEFMRRMGEHFEVVIFTASLSKYADPVMDLLDPQRICAARLFREHCSNHQGVYVKDLSRLGRLLKDTIIVDNSPTSYLFHPENAVPIGSWFDDRSDTELQDLIPFLEALTKVDDVCSILDPRSGQ